MNPIDVNAEGAMNSHIIEVLQTEGPKDIDSLLASLVQKYPDDAWTKSVLQSRLRMYVIHNFLVCFGGRYQIHPLTSQFGFHQAIFYGDGTVVRT